jgi:hypothetical protein
MTQKFKGLEDNTKNKYKKINTIIKEEWLSLGDRMFLIDDLVDVAIQKNHLILTFEGHQPQICIYFGDWKTYTDSKTSDAYLACKNVYDQICKLKNASIVKLPKCAIVSPDIIDTFYGDELEKVIQDRKSYAVLDIKKNHKKKIDKAFKIIEDLKGRLKDIEALKSVRPT